MSVPGKMDLSLADPIGTFVVHTEKASLRHGPTSHHGKMSQSIVMPS